MPREKKQTSKNTNKKPVQKKEQAVVEQKTGMNEATRGMIIGVVITMLIMGIVVLLILGSNDDNGNQTLSGNATETMRSFHNYFNADELALIVIAQESCPFCSMYKPIVDAVAEELNVKYLYIDIDQLRLPQAEVENIMGMLGADGGVPFSAVVKNGKVVKNWSGFAEGDNLVAHLIEAGMLPANTVNPTQDHIVTINYEKFEELLNSATASVIILETIPCPSCTEARFFLNSLGRKHNVNISQIMWHRWEESWQISFFDNLEKMGLPENISAPLTMIVKGGKVIAYRDQFSEAERATITTMLIQENIID